MLESNLIYFVSDRLVRNNNYKGITQLSSVEGKALLITKKNEDDFKGFCFDVEANGLDPFVNKLLLASVGWSNYQVVIDCLSINLFEFLSDIFDDNTVIVGQNLKYDLKICLGNVGLYFSKIYDTMIVEERLFKGLELRNDLASIVQRYTSVTLLKDIRGGFVGVDARTYIPTIQEIKYSAEDIRHLPTVIGLQTKYIAKYNMERLLYDIEFPLVSILARAENYGLVLDVPHTRKLYADNIAKKFELECKLDECFRELRDWLLFDDPDIMYLTGGKFDAERRQIIVKQHNMFSDDTDDEIIKSKRFINYASSDDIITIIGRLKQPMPTKSGGYAIPTFDKKGKAKGIGYDKKHEFTTDEKIFSAYLTEFPDSIIKPFIELLYELREVIGRINKFGENFIQKINPVTGRIHTIYRQCKAENGRFESGGGRNEPDKFQSQNHPAELEYRQMFRDIPGRKIITADLAGAEVVIMADFANDRKLLDLFLGGDIHGYMATSGWRAVWRHRGDSEKATNFVVSKSENKELRTRGKNATFGFIYGMGAYKASKTLGINQEEAKAYGAAVKGEVPKTVKMVENNVQIGLSQGFIVFNERTNSRLWFNPIRVAIVEGKQLTGEEQAKIGGKCRNTPISGTQADIIKEAIVRLDLYFAQNKLDVQLMLQVHDELVYSAPDEIAEEVGKIVKEIMTTTAALYLKHLPMGASVEIKDTWIK